MAFFDGFGSDIPQTWNRYAYVGGRPLEAVDPSGLCGNLVVGGSTQAPGTAESAAEDDFAWRIGAQAIYPFAGQSLLGSMAGIEATDNVGAGTAAVKAAIAGLAAAGPGDFTLYGFSGGAQVIQTALYQLPPWISARARVVGISPGYGVGIPQLPNNALTVWGGGDVRDLGVMVAASANGLYSASTIFTGCGHDADCEFGSAWGSLFAMASPACPAKGPRAAAPSGGSSGGGGGFGAGAGGYGGGADPGAFLLSYVDWLLGRIGITPTPLGEVVPVK